MIDISLFLYILSKFFHFLIFFQLTASIRTDEGLYLSFYLQHHIQIHSHAYYLSLIEHSLFHFVNKLHDGCQLFAYVMNGIYNSVSLQGSWRPYSCGIMPDLLHVNTRHTCDCRAGKDAVQTVQ